MLEESVGYSISDPFYFGGISVSSGCLDGKFVFFLIFFAGETWG